MISVLKSVKPVAIEILADLPGLTMNGSTVPPDILCTGQRPDVVYCGKRFKENSTS